MVVVGALFTFLAIAYSTSRAATQSKALVGKGRRAGAIALPDDEATSMVTEQPSKKDSLRIQAMMAAVEAGSLPASALEEDDSDDEDAPGAPGTNNDDERLGTRYNYTWFHVIFAAATMYTAMLLTDWCAALPGLKRGRKLTLQCTGILS